MWRFIRMTHLVIQLIGKDLLTAMDDIATPFRSAGVRYTTLCGNVP